MSDNNLPEEIEQFEPAAWQVLLFDLVCSAVFSGVLLLSLSLIIGISVYGVPAFVGGCVMYMLLAYVIRYNTAEPEIAIYVDKESIQ